MTKLISLIIFIVLIISVVDIRGDDECNTCYDNSSCCGDEKCCKPFDLKESAFCCPETSECCPSSQDGPLCCDAATESCCSEKGQESICCVKQPSFCCPSTDKHPARCCPRWTVCCTFEDLGCCTPNQVALSKSDLVRLQLEMLGVLTESSSPSSLPLKKIGNINATKSTALFQHGGGAFRAYQFSNADGQDSFIDVKGYDTFGESTRMFLYNQAANVFYMLQANFTQPPQSPQDPKRPIHLYTVDPITGRTSQTLIENAQNQVTGLVYSHQQKSIIFATRWWDSGKSVGYKFYSLDPTCSQAKLLSSLRTTTMTQDPWAGYISGLSADGTILYRVGYQNAETGERPGLGMTDISKSPATTKWISPIPVPPQHQFYVSSNVLYSNTSATQPTFLSLSPNLFGKLALVEWSPYGKAKVLIQLDNAHEPAIFGSLAEVISDDNQVYSAMLVKDARRFTRDKWELLTVNLNAPSTNFTLVETQPTLNSGVNSISGLGIVQQS